MVIARFDNEPEMGGRSLEFREHASGHKFVVTADVEAEGQCFSFEYYIPKRDMVAIIKYLQAWMD